MKRTRKPRGTAGRATPPGSTASGSPGGSSTGGRSGNGRATGGASTRGRSGRGRSGGPSTASASTAARATGGRSAAPVGRRLRTDPWKAGFVILLMIGLVGAAVWVVLGSRLLVVRDVRISGLHRLDRTEVLHTAAVSLGTPLARLDGDAVRARVATIAQVKSAKVTRDWPSTLRIEVTERTPRAAVARDGRYALVDADGVTVATARTPSGLPMLKVDGDPNGDPAVRSAVTAVTALPDRLAGRLRQVSAADPEHVRMRLRTTWKREHRRPHRVTRTVTVVWGDAHRGVEKARVLSALLRHRAKVYDVSAPDVATTR